MKVLDLVKSRHEVFSIQEDATSTMPLDECLRLMEKHGLFHLVVLEEPGRFLGVISVADLLQVIASDHKSRAEMFEAFLFSRR